MQKKKTGSQITTLLVLLAVIAGFAFILIQSGAFAEKDPNNDIRMEVNCSGGYSLITYRIGDFVTDDTLTISTPWKKKFTAQDCDKVFLTAWNPSSTGKISCKIYLNGVLWDEEVAEYPVEVVACGGLVPHK